MKHLLPLPRFALLLLAAVLCACSTTGGLGKKSVRPKLYADEWVAGDGKTMPCKVWPVPQGVKERGVLITIHGLSGAKSDFWYLGEVLPPRGYAVYAYDLRGQGHDPVVDERGDISGEKAWKRDLATFHSLVRRKHPRTPVFWYGESLGSLIALHTAADQLWDWADPDGIILATPAAGLRMTVGGFQRFLLETAARLSPKSRFSLGELAGVDESKIQVTSGSTHGGQMAVTPHHISQFSLRLLTTVGSMIDKSKDAARRLRMPVLFVASPKDVLSSADQIQGLFAAVRSRDKKLLWYTRSYHLLLHDVQHEEVGKDVLKWLDRQVKEPGGWIPLLP